MRKLHMGTMSYGADSMDEVAHQLELAFGILGDNGKCSAVFFFAFLRWIVSVFSVDETGNPIHWYPVVKRSTRHVFKSERCSSQSCSMS